MVKSVSSLTRNGLRDWLIQHLTAAFMTIYVVGLVAYVIAHPAMDFYSWHALFTNNFIRIATLLFYLFLVVHAWIGLWTIATDYLKNTFIRLAFLMIVLLILFATLIWCIQILWGL
jgi:succinate dehydrogenase / fumarate reductase, membrane anchor subunit